MRTTEVPRDQSAQSSPSPAQAFGMVLDAAVGTVAAKLERKTAGWIDKLSAVAGENHSTDAIDELTDAGWTPWPNPEAWRSEPVPRASRPACTARVRRGRRSAPYGGRGRLR